MTEALAGKLGVNTLVGDMTPWWWKSEWPSTEPKRILGALRIIRALRWADEATVSLSSDRLAVMLEVTNETDVPWLHERLRELKLFLDEMVPGPPVPGVEHESDGLE
jgi:hypothetical protein